MPEITDPEREQERNRRHLRHLSIAYYVFGALQAVCSFVPGVHCCLGIGMIAGLVSRDPDAETAGVIVLLIGILSVALGLFFAAATAFNGFLLSRRMGHPVCVALAILTCLHFPVGTALGVVTLIVLMRDSTKLEFGR